MIQDAHDGFGRLAATGRILGLLLLLPLTARAEEWPRPYVIAKLGVGIPGVPGLSAEFFLRDSLTVEAGGGNGPIGAYGSLSARWRPCWGCREQGAALSAGLGPELIVIPSGEQGRTGIILAAISDLAFSYRFAPRFGWTVGLKLGIGPEWDFLDGALYVVEPALVVALYTGFQF
jgi:hypothetical protein